MDHHQSFVHTQRGERIGIAQDPIKNGTTIHYWTVGKSRGDKMIYQIYMNINNNHPLIFLIYSTTP